MASFQLELPLKKSSEYGFAHIKTPQQSIAQGLKMLLLTIPGEKIDDSTYGCGLLKIPFEFDSQILRQEAEGNIRQQIKKYLPMVQLTDINFNKKQDQDILYITIKYYIGSPDNIESITFTLDNI